MSAWTQLPESLRTLAAGSPDAVLLETSRFDEQNHHSYLFLNPIEAVSANTADELHALFGWIESARQRGLHLAGYLAYECGYFLEHKLRRDSTPAPATGDSLPLAWFGAYAQPFVFDHSVGDFLGPAPPAAPSVAPPEIFVSEAALDIPQDEYTRKILAIKRYIEAGDTYQVNFTDSVTMSTHHDAAACLAVLSKTQPVAYGALLNVSGHHIVSLSPELFFRIRDGSIVTRPMKGTMPRGLDIAEDEQQMARLEADEKNRSEHVMIVDLLRNDLGRICRMGSVHADPLFAVERYRTLLQMTSTVSGELRPSLTFDHIFHALFPSGSITGAPKIRTMQIIHELERQPRGVYTGAIGHIAPSGDAEFNVAIRTLVLRDGIAHGWESAEASLPTPMLRRSIVSASSRRPFSLAPRRSFSSSKPCSFDGDGMPFLPLHLDRLASSAAYFDFPFDRSAIESRIEELAASLAPHQRFRIRLLLAANGEVTVSPTAITEDSAPLTIRISPCRVNSGDLLLRHKTTQRELYDREYARARQDGFDEVLFLNEKEELTEGAISTLFVNLEGSLLTPPLASGVLPGVLRRHVLATEPNAAERPLTLDDLRSAEAAFLGNSVRGLRPIARIEMADPELPPILFPRILFPARPA